MSISRNGLECTITPGSGRSDSMRIAPARTVPRDKARAQQLEMVEAVEQRQHEPRRRAARGAAQRRGRRPWSRRSARRSARSLALSARGCASKSPSSTLRTRRPRSLISAAVASRARIVTSLPARHSAPATKPPTPPGPSTAIFTTPAPAAPRGSSRPPDRARLWPRAAPARTPPGAGAHTRRGDRARPRGGG